MSEGAYDQGHGYRVPVKNPTNRIVPWAFKLWPSITDKEKDMIRNHFETFQNTEEATAYKKYLRDWCMFPSDWLEILPQT